MNPTQTNAAVVSRYPAIGMHGCSGCAAVSPKQGQHWCEPAKDWVPFDQRVKYVPEKVVVPKANPS